MSTKLSDITHSPETAWAAFKASPDAEQAIVEVKSPIDTKVKKRKNGGSRDIPDREEVGFSIKRPRHSISGVLPSELNQTSTAPPSPTFVRSAGSGFPDPNRGNHPQTGSVKPLRSPTYPVPATFGQTQSTASNLAALWPVSAPQDVSLAITKWRERHRDRVRETARVESMANQDKGKEREPDKWKSKGKEKEVISATPDYFGDSSDGGVSSSAGPIRNAGVGSTGKRRLDVSGSGSEPRRASLDGSNPTRGKDARKPLYVNKQRQIARKTGGSSKPPRIIQFDREVTSSSGSGSDAPARPPDSSHLLSNEDETKRPQIPGTRRRIMARKSAAWPPKQGALLSWISPKKKAIEQQTTEPKRRNSDPEVIVIESSSDEDAARKSSRTVLPPKQSRKSFAQGSSSGSKTAKTRDKKSRTKDISEGNKGLIMALNQAYGGQGARTQAPSTSKKSLEENIIDLTIEDPSSHSQSGRSKSPSIARSPQNKPTLSPARPPSNRRLSIQAPSSPPPMIPPILSPIPANDLLGQGTVAGVVPNVLKDELIRRPRSVPIASTPDPSLAMKTSASAGLSPPISPDKAIIRRPTLPSRVRRVIRSPSQEVDDSESAEEHEVYQAMIEDSGPSSKGAQSGIESDDMIPALPAVSSSGGSARVSPNLIPPLRRSLRSSSGSLHSELDNLVPFTDVESPPDSSPSPEPEETTGTLSYGGFKALTWEDHKKDIRNFQLKYYSAKDLPTALPDSVNRLSEYTRMDQGMRDVFRAYMLENIVEDEAGAPDIEILNDVDHDPTPLFEFIYSNKIWYGDGVPLPDYQKLQGCDCVGRCDPKSKTCTCAQRQRKFLQEGCVYEKNGRLKYPGYPIFECNELCACDDDCRNRVVQHGRKCQVSIKKTKMKGWGVFNSSKRIPRGTLIGIYSGELITDEQGELRGRYYDKIGKTYLFDVDFWHLKPEENNDDWHNKYTVDAFHAGNFTRFLNHSCDPNARLNPCYINEPDVEKPLLVVFSIRDIDPFEEICFSYTGRYPDDEQEEETEKGSDTVRAVCYCGAKNCTGSMWG